MSYNPKSLFNKIQSKEQAIAENSGAAGGGFSNPLIFKPKPGTTYAVRLLWLSPADGSDREYPMINSYIHRVWDENATGSKDNKVVCPTSQYMMGEVPSAFKKCPICAAASDFYKKGQEGSESAKELYSKFRRTCLGYIPIYIVNGPEDDIGQIKILQYGKQFRDFFDSKIFGIKKQNKNEEVPVGLDDEAIGLEAFMYYDETLDKIANVGYDLLITTTSKKMNIGGKSVDMPQYQLDFSRRPKMITELDSINIETEEGVAYFNSLNADILNFDKDFYIKSTEEDLHAFKLNFISGEAIDTPTASKPAISLPKKPVVETPAVEEDAIPYDYDEKPAEKPVVKSKPAVKAAPKAMEPADDDIDSLIDGLV